MYKQIYKKLIFKNSSFNTWRFARKMSSSIKIKVSQGVVVGVQDKLPNGEDYCYFRGIPYAKPPLGQLRFKEPEPLIKFAEPELDCSSEREMCYQKSMIYGDYKGSEDCLFLNVYAPKISSGPKKSVMIYIHGGAFSLDCGNADLYSPEYLIQEDVIVVTFNYRLHALGFIQLPSMGISGNAGLKDQQMAIKWVHDNISQFNGDPKNVTLFSESAGAASAHLHVLSEKSRKYINRAIMQSGCALGDWVLQRNGVEKTKSLANMLGGGKSDQEIYDTLMKATPKELFNNLMKTLTPEEKRRGLPIIFKPVLEEEGPNAFITKAPLDLLKQNDELNVAVMFGVNDQDGMVMLSNARKKLELFEEDMSRMIPTSVNIPATGPLATQLGNEIRKFYFGDKKVDKKSLEEFGDLMTDYHFLLSQTIANEMHSKYQHKSKQYVYEFGFDGQLNMFKKILQLTMFKGACHADELYYLFVMKLAETDVSNDSREAKMRNTMCKLWTNFAKYGNPTPDFNNPLPFKWEPVKNVAPESSNVDINCLKINETSEMAVNLHKKRMDFWRDVYKKWNQNFLNPKL